MANPLDRNQLFSFAKQHRDEYEALLKQFVETPTVSCDPSHAEDIRAGLDLTVETLRRFGGKADIYKAKKGNPLVHGVFGTSKNVPTVTVYNHIDVQPASKETEPWDTEPFVMTKKGDSYLGRGTTDDKGPALAALFGARAAMAAGIPINIHFLWEFEEEIGSPNFEQIISKAKSNLRTDSVVVSDTVWVSRKRPASSAGLRGLLGFLLQLETGEVDTHSGETGGASRNPIAELMRLVCDLYDPKTGKIKIKGFYDDVIPLTKKELSDWANCGFSARAFKKAHHLKLMRTEDELEVMKRIWGMPTFEVHGVTGGYQGPGVKSIVPPRAEVKASFRLVPGQDPGKIQKQLTAAVKELNANVKIQFESAAPAFRTVLEGPLPEALKRAVKFAFKRDAVFVRDGGTIGAMTSIEKVLQCPVLFLGLSLPEHGYHAPNENFDWQQASGGMVAFAKYFEEIANLHQK
ncbi:MAG TPA: M20/M25/M40 family metallo-hydrolase [Pyrinomonadaceae bacterium]|jgi:acetylornithine deacetylase/succinyl-diaminopimelate desuccinylase-like protein|nr:M20/M25/M40 family metallo-hydrolase [Pyrinomonadaceae bacterium]